MMIWARMGIRSSMHDKELNYQILVGDITSP